MRWKRSWLVGGALLLLGFAAGRATAPRLDPALQSVTSFRWALEDPDWLTRSHRMSAFLLGLSPETLPAAVEALEPHVPWLVTEELRLFMMAWSRFDAPGALRSALSWSPPFHRNASGAAIYAWAFRDPQAALAALESVEDEELRGFMEGRLVAGWVHGPQKESASRWIASLDEGPRRFQYVGLLAWELAKQGPQALVQWAEELPADESGLKSAVFLKASTTLAAVDPESTARWLAPHVDRPYARDVLRVVVRSWAGTDPTAALEWLKDLPAGPERDGSVANAFAAWHNREPEAAERWLGEATPQRLLDPAVRVLVGRWQQRAPQRALRWAGAIEDPALRRQAQMEAGRAWLRREPEAARRGLAAGRLPQAVLDGIAAPQGQEPGGAGRGQGSGPGAP